LTAVPLFLFMGYIVERAGIVAKLFFAIRLAASYKLPASMAVAALITCTLFSTATGIIGAVVTLMGLLSLACNGEGMVMIKNLHQELFVQADVWVF
jgi:TRAP-type mannitol/chloroaromatic compound transport system permease large subunit